MRKSKTCGSKGSPDRDKRKEWEGRSCVRYRCGQINTVQDVLRQRPGWVEVKDEGEWDFNWCDLGSLRENFGHSYMEKHVRINHFCNHYELTRKNLMVKNLKRYRKYLEKDVGRMEASKCDFFPCTFALPSEYHLLVEEFKRSPGSIWIMKPAAKAEGKGIFLFKKLKDIVDWKKDGTRSEEQQKDAAQVESYVAQRYIENPYLINGRKFDLRVYVLVTSYVPLKAWLYRDGFGRLSSTRYSLSSIDDKYTHLTNVSVQRTAPDYDPEECKWQIQPLRTYLTAKHGREVVESMFKEMDNIIIRSLQSVQNVIINDKHCFELYGYDILLDQTLKPWLIEVNASPSFKASSQEDYKLKCRLLEDTLNVVDMERRLTGKEKRVGGFDLMWNDGPVYREDVNPETFSSSCLTANTHLGCVNDRENQLRHLLKPFPGQRRM